MEGVKYSGGFLNSVEGTQKLQGHHRPIYIPYCVISEVTTDNCFDKL